MTTRNTTAYWIIWNGRGLRQDGALRPVYRRDHGTIELVRCDDVPPGSEPVLLCPPRRNVTFTVPDVSSGAYPVVIYDGEESGFHYTWDLFRVTTPSDSDHHVYLVVALAASAAVVVTILLGHRRRRPNST